MALPDLPETFEYQRASKAARGQAGRTRVHISRPVPQWPDDRWPPMVPLCKAKARMHSIGADRLPLITLDDLCTKCEAKMPDETWRAAVHQIENARVGGT
jgi:hypothetical protein